MVGSEHVSGTRHIDTKYKFKDSPPRKLVASFRSKRGKEAIQVVLSYTRYKITEGVVKADYKYNLFSVRPSFTN